MRSRQFVILLSHALRHFYLLKRTDSEDHSTSSNILGLKVKIVVVFRFVVAAVRHGIVHYTILQLSNLRRVWITIFDFSSSLMMEINDVDADQGLHLQLGDALVIFIDY